MSEFNIRKMLRKVADFPMIPGETHWGSRGLNWQRFDPYNPDPELPAALSQLLIGKSAEFKDAFARYVGMSPEQFGGMIFAIYANDTAISEDIEEAAVGAGLSEAANFVKEKSVKLTTDIDPNKQIGSDFWLSWYGYAYKDLIPNGVIDVARARPAELRNVTHEKHRRQFSTGPLEIDQLGRGYGIVIRTEQGDEPVYWGQAPNSLRKLFKGNLELNKSQVFAPNGPQGSLEPATKPRTNHLPEEMAQRIIDEYKEKRSRPDFLWKAMIDESGAIYIQQGKNENLVMHYISPEQIQTLMRPEVLQSETDGGAVREEWFKKPGQNGERPSSFGPFELTDEAKAAINDPSNPVGIPALQQLRGLVEERNGSDYHVPYEGWKVIMVGPKFSIAENLGEGQAFARPQFAVPSTKAVPGDVVGGELITVNRGHKWTVLSMEFSPARDRVLAAATKSRGTPDQEDFETPQDAVAYLGSLYLNMSHDEIDTNDEGILAGIKEDVIKADEALRSAIGGQINEPMSYPGAPVTPEQPIQTDLTPEQPNPTPENPAYTRPDEQKMADVRRSLRRIMKR